VNIKQYEEKLATNTKQGLAFACCVLLDY